MVHLDNLETLKKKGTSVHAWWKTLCRKKKDINWVAIERIGKKVSSPFPHPRNLSTMSEKKFREKEKMDVARSS